MAGINTHMQFDDLNDAQKEVFRLYKGNSPCAGQHCFADFLNTSLATGQTLDNFWEDKARILDAVIASGVQQVDQEVFRATLDPYVPRANDGEIIYAAYLSTAAEQSAVQKHFASPFRNVPAALLRIDCPAGSRMLDLETNLAFGTLEHEYLLPRRSRLQVVAVNWVSDEQEMHGIMGPFAYNCPELAICDLRYVGVADV